MIFLRHPRPSVAPGVCYGRLDLPLGSSAPDQIAAACGAVEAPGMIVTSPSSRCLALAAALSNRFSLPARQDPRLLELDFGQWEGRFWSEIDRAESDPWAADPWRVAAPGGETFASLHARVAERLADLPERTVVVTHAGPIRAARMILTGASFERVFAEPVPYATPLELRFEGVAAHG